MNKINQSYCFLERKKKSIILNTSNTSFVLIFNESLRVYGPHKYMRPM